MWFGRMRHRSCRVYVAVLSISMVGSDPLGLTSLAKFTPMQALLPLVEGTWEGGGVCSRITSNLLPPAPASPVSQGEHATSTNVEVMLTEYQQQNPCSISHSCIGAAAVAETMANSTFLINNHSHS